MQGADGRIRLFSAFDHLRSQRQCRVQINGVLSQRDQLADVNHGLCGLVHALCQIAELRQEQAVAGKFGCAGGKEFVGQGVLLARRGLTGDICYAGQVSPNRHLPPCCQRGILLAGLVQGHGMILPGRLALGKFFHGRGRECQRGLRELEAFQQGGDTQVGFF